MIGRYLDIFKNIANNSKDNYTEAPIKIANNDKQIDLAPVVEELHLRGSKSNSENDVSIKLR